MVLVHFMRTALRTAALAGAAAAIFCAAPAAAAQCGDDADGFGSWLASFKQEAAQQGISRSVIESPLSRTLPTTIT